MAGFGRAFYCGIFSSVNVCVSRKQCCGERVEILSRMAATKNAMLNERSGFLRQCTFALVFFCNTSKEIDHASGVVCPIFN